MAKLATQLACCEKFINFQTQDDILMTYKRICL
jgi:hypothetical protein